MSWTALGAAVNANGAQVHDGGLPELAPLSVVAYEDVEALLSSARADLAKLQLELRGVLHDAGEAEAEPAHVPQSDRAERAAEIEYARQEAARRVQAARKHAEDLVATAREELLQAVLATVDPAPVVPAEPPRAYAPPFLAPPPAVPPALAPTP
ncbi:MAG: hypothetical protein ACRD12_24785, partial [Acidimicrobiales bacterium]